MKFRPLFQTIAAALLIGALPAAKAAPTLSFSLDGGGPITCADGALCDLNPLAGVVTYSASIGDFLVNVTTGVSKPVLTGTPSLMDLNSINIQTTGGAHTLSIMFTDSGFDQSGLITGLFGGTLTGGTGASITASAFTSATDVLFANDIALGAAGPFGPGAFSGTFSGVSVAGPDYSLTQVLTLRTVGATTYSGDFEMRIPEPGTLALLGLGLVGLAATRRRKQ